MISTTDPAIFLLTCLLLPLSMPIHWEGLYARDLLIWSCPGRVKDNLNIPRGPATLELSWS